MEPNSIFLEGVEAVRKGIVTSWWQKIQNIVRVYGIDPSRFQNIATWKQYVQDRVKEKTRETHIQEIANKSTQTLY